MFRTISLSVKYSEETRRSSSRIYNSGVKLCLVTGINYTIRNPIPIKIIQIQKSGLNTIPIPLITTHGIAIIKTNGNSPSIKTIPPTTYNRNRIIPPSSPIQARHANIIKISMYPLLFSTNILKHDGKVNIKIIGWWFYPPPDIGIIIPMSVKSH